jgi:phospholipid/cholesterol/gamma-HCH transport system permease protein
MFLFGRKRYRLSLKQFVDQVLFTGLDALWLVGFIGLITGIVISIQASAHMPQIGAGAYFGNVMVIAIVRELGPIITALVVVGRSAAALAAYVGNMKITSEITMLRAMGIDIVHFLVQPAFVGMIVAMLCLNVYFDIVAVVGGLLFAKVIVDLDFFISFSKIVHALSIGDIVLTVLKSVLFGAIVAILSCYHGLSVTTVREVPRAVFRTVVHAIIVVMLVTAFITLGWYWHAA